MLQLFLWRVIESTFSVSLLFCILMEYKIPNCALLNVRSWWTEAETEQIHGEKGSRSPKKFVEFILPVAQSNLYFFSSRMTVTETAAICRQNLSRRAIWLPLEVRWFGDFNLCRNWVFVCQVKQQETVSSVIQSRIFIARLLCIFCINVQTSLSFSWIIQTRKKLR